MYLIVRGTRQPRRIHTKGSMAGYNAWRIPHMAIFSSVAGLANMPGGYFRWRTAENSVKAKFAEFTDQDDKRCMLTSLKMDADFSGVHALNEQACISSDPPCHLWIASCLYCLCLSRFLPLTEVNVYSLLPYLVLGNKLQGVEIGHHLLP